MKHSREGWNLRTGSSPAAVMLKTEPPTAAKFLSYPIFLNLEDTKWQSLKWGIGNIEELCRVGSDTYDSSTVKRTMDIDTARKSVSLVLERLL